MHRVCVRSHGLAQVLRRCDSLRRTVLLPHSVLRRLTVPHRRETVVAMAAIPLPPPWPPPNLPPPPPPGRPPLDAAIPLPPPLRTHRVFTIDFGHEVVFGRSLGLRLFAQRGGFGHLGILEFPESLRIDALSKEYDPESEEQPSASRGRDPGTHVPSISWWNWKMREYGFEDDQVRVDDCIVAVNGKEGINDMVKQLKEPHEGNLFIVLYRSEFAISGRVSVAATASERYYFEQHL